MADYGLLIKNAASEIQIDSAYRNLSLDESGSSAAVSNYCGGLLSGTYFTSISLTASPLVPVVLVRPGTDYFVSIKSYVKSGGNYAGFRAITECALPFGTTFTTHIDWQSYRENRLASSEIYGMRVYNPSGQLCFDSGKSYFKINSVHSISLVAPTPTSLPYTDITHSAANPYYLLSPMGYYVGTVLVSPEIMMTRIGFYLIGIKKIDSTHVRVGWYLFGYYQLSGLHSVANGINPTMKLLVCTP